MFTITCYNRTDKFEEADRQKMISFYETCFAYSDGNEQRRYKNILEGLLTNETEVKDYEGDDVYGTKKDLCSRR